MRALPFTGVSGTDARPVAFPFRAVDEPAPSEAEPAPREADEPPARTPDAPPLFAADEPPPPTPDAPPLFVVDEPPPRTPPFFDADVAPEVAVRFLDVFGGNNARSERPTAGAVGIPASKPSVSSSAAAAVTGGIAARPVAGAVRESAASAADDSPGSIGAIGTPARPVVPVAGIEAAAAPGPSEIAPSRSASGRSGFRVPAEGFEVLVGRAPEAEGAAPEGREPAEPDDLVRAGRAAAEETSDSGAAAVAGEESPGRAERGDVVAEVLADFLAAAMVGPPWDFCACATAPGAACAGAVMFACAAARSGCRSGLTLPCPAFVLGLPRLVALLDLLQGVRGVFRGGEGADPVFGRAQVRV